jgi:broad specificity phosphatase PhoE
MLVRHGQINSNVLNVYSGSSSEPLNSLGLQQSSELASKLAHLTFSSFYSSPLLRCVQTARIISERHNMHPIVDSAFTELKLGPWEGLDEASIASRYPEEWHIWNTFPSQLRIEGRETLFELQHRVLDGLSALPPWPSDSITCIVSHVAVIRVVYLYIHALDLVHYKKIPIPNATSFIFELP